MPRLVNIVRALHRWPEASNTWIARRVPCDPRIVGRYRAILKEKRTDPAELQGWGLETLSPYLNPVRRVYAEPDYAGLRKALPGASGRALWREYVRRQEVAGEPALCYAQFMRRADEVLP
jgi:hypothetical protein